MKTLIILMAVGFLSACTTQREMPVNEGDESDVMRPSPCACNEVNYDERGFKWVS